MVDKYHEEFLGVLAQLTAMRLEKVRQYGTRRYESKDEAFDRMMSFSDIYRKFIRLENQINHGTIEELLETGMDLAAYSVMLVQLLSRYRSK